MNIEQLNEQFTNETVCRQFFEAARWPKGRICPHSSLSKIYYRSGVLDSILEKTATWYMQMRPCDYNHPKL